VLLLVLAIRSASISINSHAAIAVTPLIIIPADHFYEAIADRQRQLAIKDAGERIANDVLGTSGSSLNSSTPL
jgi:hypothetical protein